MGKFKKTKACGSGCARIVVENCEEAPHVELTGPPIRVLHMQNQLNTTKKGGRSRRFGDVSDGLTYAAG